MSTATKTGVQRQIAMVLDLNKCLNCQTCTVSCKKLWNKDAGTDYAYWNNVETRPGTGYPKQWSELGGRDEQQAAMVRFIHASKSLRRAVLRKDFDKFARVYNGDKTGRYAGRIRKVYEAMA